MRGLIDSVAALPFALLPKRPWQSFDLPVAHGAGLSAFLVMAAGFILGVPGYFYYLARLQGVTGLSMLEVGKLQVEGKLPETAEVGFPPIGLHATAAGF